MELDILSDKESAHGLATGVNVRRQDNFVLSRAALLAAVATALSGCTLGQPGGQPNDSPVSTDVSTSGVSGTGTTFAAAETTSTPTTDAGLEKAKEQITYGDLIVKFSTDNFVSITLPKPDQQLIVDPKIIGTKLAQLLTSKDSVISLQEMESQLPVKAGDSNGFVSKRYVQVYEHKGRKIRIVGGEMAVNIKNQSFESATGVLHQDINLVQPDVGISPNTAKSFLAKSKTDLNIVEISDKVPELVIVPLGNKDFALAYQIMVAKKNNRREGVKGLTPYYVAKVDGQSTIIQPVR